MWPFPSKNTVFAFATCNWASQVSLLRVPIVCSHLIRKLKLHQLAFLRVIRVWLAYSTYVTLSLFYILRTKLAILMHFWFFFKFLVSWDSQKLKFIDYLFIWTVKCLVHLFKKSNSLTQRCRDRNGGQEGEKVNKSKRGKDRLMHWLTPPIPGTNGAWQLASRSSGLAPVRWQGQSCSHRHYCLPGSVSAETRKKTRSQDVNPGS